ncbi:MAG TPA: DUF1801 domain-containing protein [Methanoregulaceae archaeon]|nr:DUF1801 domain-containing protein [Methanoregulaceae archaeon]
MREQTMDTDAYIASFPPRVQDRLREIRAAIRNAVPDAGEAIRYGIPTFRLDGANLVHFAAFSDHIGFFPTPSGIQRFRDELSAYSLSKGTVRIPPEVPVPADLIGRIAKFRAGEVRQKGKKGKKKNV